MDQSVFIAFASATAIFSSSPVFAQVGSGEMICELRKSDQDYDGRCAVPCQTVSGLDARTWVSKPVGNCTEPPRQVNVNLRRSDDGAGWIGNMQGKWPEDPTRFEVTGPKNGATGVAKTPFGWFELKSAAVSDQSISLVIAAGQLLPPSVDDIKIIQRAASLLASEITWDREDNRVCRPNPKKWSLFCALMQATEEVSAGVHYRQPALQAVREVLNEVGGARLKKHRLMDYNNHPDTTLDDIQKLLSLARSRLENK